MLICSTSSFAFQRSTWPPPRRRTRQEVTATEAVKRLHAVGGWSPKNVQILHVGRVPEVSREAKPFRDIRLAFLIRSAVREDPDNDDALTARDFGPIGHLWPRVFCDTVMLIRVPRIGIAAVYLSDPSSALSSEEQILRFLARELHEAFWGAKFGCKAVADKCLEEWFLRFCSN